MPVSWDDDEGKWLRGDALDNEELKEQAGNTPLQILQWYVGGESTKFQGYINPSILHLENTFATNPYKYYINSSSTGAVVIIITGARSAFCLMFSCFS